MENPFGRFGLRLHQINVTRAVSADQRVRSEDLSDSKPRFVWEIPSGRDGGALLPTSGGREVLLPEQLQHLTAIDVVAGDRHTRIKISPGSRLLNACAEEMLIHDPGNDLPPQIINTRNPVSIEGVI